MFVFAYLLLGILLCNRGCFLQRISNGFIFITLKPLNMKLLLVKILSALSPPALLYQYAVQNHIMISGF